MGPEGWRPKPGKSGAPKGGRAQNFAFFSLSRHCFHSFLTLLGGPFVVKLAEVDWPKSSILLEGGGRGFGVRGGWERGGFGRRGGFGVWEKKKEKKGKEKTVQRNIGAKIDLFAGRGRERRKKKKEKKGKEKTVQRNIGAKSTFLPGGGGAEKKKKRKEGEERKNSSTENRCQNRLFFREGGRGFRSKGRFHLSLRALVRLLSFVLVLGFALLGVWVFLMVLVLVLPLVGVFVFV